MADPDNSTYDILVVDDTVGNLRLITTILKNAGYQTRPVTNGRLALRAIDRKIPDLVMLDINMPKMNGFEVCEQLKSDPRYASIPIVFISAMADAESKVKSFRAGGIDYITKPFHVDEVLARVGSHLTIRDLQAKLQNHNKTLEQDVAAKTRELAQAHQRLHRLDHAKSDFLKLISHELRTPLNGVLGVIDLIFDLGESPSEDLHTAYAASRQRLVRLLDDAQLLTEISVDLQPVETEPIPLDTAYAAAVDELASQQITDHLVLPTIPSGHQVLGSQALVERVLSATLGTLIGLAPADAELSLEASTLDGQVLLVFQSNLGTLADTTLTQLFQVFSLETPLTPGGDIGLCAPVASRIADVLNGSLTVANSEPVGFMLSLTLPNA